MGPDLPELQRVAFESAGVAMLLVDEEGKLLLVNREFERLSGYPREEVEGKKSWEEFVAPEDLERMRRYRKLRMEDPEAAPRRYEFRFLDCQGEGKPVLATVERIPGTKYVVASLLDLTEFRKLERTLEESESRYRALVEASRDAILMLDPGRKVIDCNRAFEELFGWKKEELVGSSVRVIHPSEESFERFGQEVYSKVAEEGFSLVEWTLRRKDGSQVEVETAVSPLRGPGGEFVGYVSVLRDVSERKRLREQMERLHRLEALGQLAAGVAHDFGNVLTTITGFVEMALRKLPEDDPLRRLLEPIRASAQGAGGIVRKLLFFGRQQPMERVPLDLNQLVEETVEVLGRFLGEDVSLNLELDPSCRSVQGDPSALRQVVTNLLLNARDAMPDGGEVSIRTENYQVDKAHCKGHGEARPGDFVRLSVRDTGVGMTQEVMDRIFEPFFTTKESGKGTGLGLSVAYGIVKEHGGWIEVESNPGQGALFRVYLPVGGVGDRKGANGHPSEGIGAKGERVLVVEDEEGVRRFTAVALKEHGYHVVEASTGEEALRAFEGGEFDLLLTDVVLPDGSGLRVAEELLRRKPGLKVVLTSGYMGEKARWEEIKERGLPFLQKPYSLKDLLRTVKKALKGA